MYRNKYLSLSEVKHLRKYAEGMALLDLEKGRSYYVKAWAIIDFLLATGCRASETRKMKIGDLDLGQVPTIKILGKGDKTRVIEIGRGLKKHLKKFIAWKKTNREDVSGDAFLFRSRRGSGYSLFGIQSVFKKMAREAGLRSCYGIHSTRHTYGFLVYNQNKNLRLTQRQLGHSNISTTQIYAHVSPEEVTQTVNSLWR